MQMVVSDGRLDVTAIAVGIGSIYGWKFPFTVMLYSGDSKSTAVSSVIFSSLQGSLPSGKTTMRVISL